MINFTEATGTGPDRPDPPQCPSCGEPTERQLTSGGMMYVCPNSDCSSLLYGADIVSEQPTEEQPR